MKRYINRLFALLVIASVWACGGKEPEPAFPDYLNVPNTLTGYKGSGLLSLEGGLSIRVAGGESIDPSTKTWSGITGSADEGQTLVNFTSGQPLSYKDNSTVPQEYRSNGQLRIMNTIAVGTYPMGIESKPTPIGAIADLTLNLPGPQIWFTRTGSLTISESTVVKTEGNSRLYRVKGTFESVMSATGTGVTTSKTVNVTGSFDVLLTNL